MKRLKLLGLTAVAAMALVGVFGGSSASASVWCKTNNAHCLSGWDYVKGDTLTWSLKSGTHAKLGFAFWTTTCQQSHKLEEVTSTGSHFSNPRAKIKPFGFSFSGCTCGERTAHISALELGEMESNKEGTATEFGTRITVQCTGLGSCIFGTLAGGTDIGKVTNSGEMTELHEEATLTWFSGEGDSSQFVCAGFSDTGTLTAEYVRTGARTYNATT